MRILLMLMTVGILASQQDDSLPVTPATLKPRWLTRLLPGTGLHMPLWIGPWVGHSRLLWLLMLESVWAPLSMLKV
jgi:hypothetical protein